MIPFNKPFLTGNETKYIEDAVKRLKISGNGHFTKLCQDFFEQKYNFKKCLLTTSCTDALEMCAILADIKPGDEVIVPSYTFVSSALAFVRQGANIIFADSGSENPNIDIGRIPALITAKTKAIVVVHYAGIACDMDRVMEIANQYGIIVIEDAAQAVDSFYKGKPLGGIGHFGAFSFHETKNIVSGEGGMLVINDEKYILRAEIIWEKGTDRAKFFRGEIDKYGWVDIGSSFLPSEIIAAFLWAQLENLEKIQSKRVFLWNDYYEKILKKNYQNSFKLPSIPKYATNNGHMFYLLFDNIDSRQRVIDTLKQNNIQAVFHYQSLHRSEFFRNKYHGNILANADKYTSGLLRLPLFCELENEDISRIVSSILE